MLLFSVLTRDRIRVRVRFLGSGDVVKGQVGVCVSGAGRGRAGGILPVCVWGGLVCVCVCGEVCVCV